MVQLMKHPELVAVLVPVALALIAVMQVLVGCAGQWSDLWPGPAQPK
jgi:energy-converting hydrogenase Eha subunit F